jgi:uncharacterized protein
MTGARSTRLLSLVVCAIAACTSATVHLYTLVPYTPGTSSDAMENPPRQRIVFESISIPSDIDRKELVMRKSPHELVLLESANWASPLREEVRRGLIANLHLALRDQAAGVPAAPASPTLIRVDVREWEATANVVHLNAGWRIHRADPMDPIDVRCESELVERTSGSADDLVRADQALLESMAKSIARVLHGDRCDEVARPADHPPKGAWSMDRPDAHTCCRVPSGP